MKGCSPAVVLLLFNRPAHATQVLDSIRKARPEKLFVVADGPRERDERDAVLCAQARDVLRDIDWPCVVERNYSNENLGLKKRVVTGLDWVFQQVEEAIVLEDDCVPCGDFFSFCANLLEYYRDDPRVWAVSGDNFLGEESRDEASYYFSKYFHCWGWGTWRRVWRQFRPEIEFWPEFSSSPRWKQLHETAEEREYWESIYNRVRSGNVNSWAFPFMLNMWMAGGLCANPQTNLVRNIGFGASGTHCHAESNLSELPTGSLRAIRHAKAIRADACADRHTFAAVYRPARPLNATGEQPHGQTGFRQDFRRFARRLLGVFGGPSESQT